MITRRKTLMGLLTTGAVALCSAAFGRFAYAQKGPPDSASSIPSDETVEAALRQDIARLGARAYSDEGIPVFLACENLSGGASVPPNDFSTRLAAKFRSNAAAWQRINPEAADTDVSKVVEILAERDFNGSEGPVS